jgi:hypothetical protein
MTRRRRVCVEMRSKPSKPVTLAQIWCDKSKFRTGRAFYGCKLLKRVLIGVACSMSAMPPIATKFCIAAKCRDVPCVDGSGLARGIFTSQAWSVLPCVRPFGAVHMTAGHNALRGSGPGQNRAFNDAMAQVGCPDRRIDRLCITCCSPSQPSHHAAFRRDLVYAASATGCL